MSETETAGTRLAETARPVARRLDLGGWLTAVASLLWLGQAALAAALLSALIAGAVDRSFAIIAVGGFTALGFLMALVGMAARETSERQMDEIATLKGLLLDRLHALVDIRLLAAGDTVIAAFADRAEALRRQTMEVLRIAFLSSTVLELFSALGMAMVAV